MRKFFIISISILFTLTIIFSSSYLYLTFKSASTQLTVSSIKAYTNQQVAITVRIDQSPGFSNIHFKLSYDPTYLKISQVKNEEITNTSMFDYNLTEPGVIDIGIISAAQINHAGLLATIYFQIQSPSEGCNIPIHAQILEIVDKDHNNISCSTSDGLITILGHNDTPIPDSPNGLYITNVLKNSATLTWNTVSGASYYKVYLNGNFIATTASNSYTFDNLNESTKYSAEISTVIGDSESNTSDLIYFTTQSGNILGDVNYSGKVDIADVLLTFQYVSGKRSVNEQFLQIADVNQDGTVNIADVIIIFQFVSGKRSWI